MQCEMGFGFNRGSFKAKMSVLMRVFKFASFPDISPRISDIMQKICLKFH